MGKSKLEARSFSGIKDDEWHNLKRFTEARIGLGRAGVSTPTSHSLAFQLAHAEAIDAVHSTMSFTFLADKLKQENVTSFPPFILHSEAEDRTTYLQRPDLGRMLSQESKEQLSTYRTSTTAKFDLVIAIVDGLSAFAVEKNALPFLSAFKERLSLVSDVEPWKVAPICLVSQGRVAVGDDICELLKARCVLVLIGERPGLSSPDSLGLYISWEAKRGTTDNYRNCISNVREAGMSYQIAANKAIYLLNEARQRKLTGVKLKDRSDDSQFIEDSQKDKSFLVIK